jgi:NitT/TauT family transport system substrate-binding protein
MRLKKWTFVILSVLILVALVLSACGSDKKEKKSVTVQLSWVHEAEWTGFYAADQQGYYGDEGLAVQIKPGGFNEAGYLDPVAQVLSGDAQFAMASAAEVFTARAAGKPIVAIANIFQASPRVFMSLAENNITRPADFVGKRVAVRSDIQAVYYAMLKAAEVNPADITEITDPALFSLDALINGDVDVLPGFITSEAVQLEQQGHPINAVLVSEYGVEDFANILVTTQDMIDKQPDEVTKFLRATLKGYRYGLDNRDSAAALVLKYDPQVDATFVGLSWTRCIPLISIAGRQVGEFDTLLWGNYYQILVDQGVVSADVNLSETYTSAFLDKLYE